MLNESNIGVIIKATIKHIIVAFIYVAIVIVAVQILFSSQISSAISLINLISVETSKDILSDVKIDLEHNKLESYPAYGTRYANIIIKDLDINLPLYYGDKLSIIRYGVGQTGSSYFPGEGGSIVCMGHNTVNFLIKLPDIKIGTKIEINTVYGDYTYTVYDTKIVADTDIGAVPIQNEEEILMLYTCYPINSFGTAKHRFVAYASLD